MCVVVVWSEIITFICSIFIGTVLVDSCVCTVRAALNQHHVCVYMCRQNSGGQRAGAAHHGHDSQAQYQQHLQYKVCTQVRHKFLHSQKN